MGWLLRTWRIDVARLRASHVAAELGVTRSTVSNWESGLRSPDPAILVRLDQCYQAGHALSDLAAALTTPRGLDPRATWWHNFDPGSGPVWAWIRPGDHRHRIGIGMSWGPLGLRLDRACDERGLIVTLPVSVANPAVRGDLDTPGWVDFGRGHIPAELTIPTISSLPHLRLAASEDHSLATSAARLRAVLEPRGNWLDILKGFLARRPDLIDTALGQTHPGPHVADLTDDTPVRSPPPEPAWSPGRYRALREARGLSQSDAATAATALMASAPVSDDQISVLEAGGRPRVPYLTSRLDVVYRADGHTTIEAVPAVTEEGTTTVNVPAWWVGPLWVTLDASPPTAPGRVTLRWPPWQKHLQLRPGTTVTTRKAPDNRSVLHVESPPGWTVTAGLGAHPTAIDVNQGWHALDRANTNVVFNHYHAVYLQLFGKTRHQLVQLLHHETLS